MIYHKKVQTYALINNYLRSYSDKFGMNILFFLHDDLVSDYRMFQNLFE